MFKNNDKMQKLQDSVFSIVKTTNLSPAVFSYLQPSEDFPDKTPLGGILSDTKHGWLALGPKFCVVDLRTGLKVAQRTFGTTLSNFRTTVTCVVELPTSLTNNSTQLLISLECEDIAGMICVFHINGSQILRCIQTEVVVTELAVCEGFPDGPFTCFDGAVMAGTKSGEIFIFDLNRSSLIQALKDISQGYEHVIRSEENSSNITFLPLNAIQQIETQRDLTIENDDHIAVLLNENSIIDGQMYIFRNPDGTVRMKAKRDHVRVTVIQYIPQLGSLAVGFNFGAFQIWNLLNMDLEFTSQVNVECLPVTHFGFQEPCDDPRAFCYLWVVFSVLDRFEEEEFPFAVMYSLTYQGKRMLSDTKCLYQEFLTATIRFQVELNTTEETTDLVGGRCVSCHTYSVNSMLGGEGEESMLNICQLVWECWGENANASSQYGMLLFDLDQWYKDQMPATYPLQSNAFMSAARCSELARGATATLDARLAPASVSAYCAATRLEEHFYPNSLRYDCICLNTSEACVLSTPGIQRQIVSSLDEVGPTALLSPARLYHACLQTGLVPLYMDNSVTNDQVQIVSSLDEVGPTALLSPARLYHACLQTGLVPLYMDNSVTNDQVQIVSSLDEVGPTALLSPARLYHACLQTGLVPLYMDNSVTNDQVQIVSSLDEVGPTALLSPARLYHACLQTGLVPLYMDNSVTNDQVQIVSSLDEVGPTALLSPARLYHACLQTGLVPLYMDNSVTNDQVQIVSSLDEVGPTALLSPARLYHACLQTGLVPLYMDNSVTNDQVQIVSSLDEVGPTALLSPARLYHACLQTGLVPLYMDNSVTNDQVQIVSSLDEVGPTALLSPARLYHACLQTGLVPLYMDNSVTNDQEEQRRYLLSVALEARLSRFLKRCAHDWATGSHAAAGCTLTFLVDWCWKRAIELKENARELTAPLFTSSALPDRNAVRCLEHCVQQLTQLTGLLDAVLTKCCNLVVPDALSEMEEKFKGIGTVSLYFQVVQWFLRVGLLPERQDACGALPYPRHQLVATYSKRRAKLHRLQDHSVGDENATKKSCPLLYIDQLIEEEFGGDRIHQMWIRGGSECNGLYPPPSLYSLLRLYLLPDIAEEHKHSLVLYLLVDYSMVYDEVRYEAVIRRLMQFPTMFGLSNTAIKATQAFWHLDHRDFDFALDQLQCLTGNTLSEWQHHVVLSALLAQRKSQAALQYLHVRKPAPTPTAPLHSSRVNEQDKLFDWQSCCSLYLSRALVFEALDVARACVLSAPTAEDKATVLNFFFNSCRNTGQLSKLLQASLLPFEEEIFIKYLENCNESQTSDILIMYYLQQSRYLEAEQYNKRLKQSKVLAKHVTASLESLADVADREGARDALVEAMCASLPNITNTVARSVCDKDWEAHIVAPKPMSVFIQARSPKNTFVYKSSFIQDSIENASETWINKPKARKGLKRALNIEETPFLCTPKLSRVKSIFSLEQTESTPPKRARLDLSGTPRTPRARTSPGHLSEQLSILLDMPEVHSPDYKLYDRRGADTPHSILKIRNSASRSAAASPVDSRYLGDSDDELLETASNHTHYSDSTNKHLRFTIPTASESGSTPSPVPPATEKELPKPQQTERDVDMSLDSFVTTDSHAMNEPHPLESPPKKLATEERVQSRKSYKDSVRGRRSLSISANSSLSDDPNTSIESIADIPITLINVRYSGDKRRSYTKDTESAESANEDKASEGQKEETSQMEMPKTPKCRKSIRVTGESTPLLSRSRSVTPERADSPVAIATPLRSVRNTRSRSRTPDISPRSSPLSTIPEQPRQETASAPHPAATMLSAPRRARSRSHTPERIEKLVESPRLEAITESPGKSSDSAESSPVRRSARSRSRTPELKLQETATEGSLSPRTLRSRAKTPEKLMSPKKDAPKSAKKPLSRLVLEANAIAASKNLEKQLESKEEKQSESIIECTPMKTLKPVSSLMDVTISPIVSKSILHSSNDSVLSETVKNKTAEDSTFEMKSLPAFSINETKFGKSVLHSYESSVEEGSRKETKTEISVSVSKAEQKSIAAFTLSDSYFGKSVLHSYQSSAAESFGVQEEQSLERKVELKISQASTSFNITDFNKSVLGSKDTTQSESQDKKDDPKNMSSLMTDDSEMEEWKKDQGPDVVQKEKEKIVEIEREINEIEHEMSEEDRNSIVNSDDDNDDEEDDDDDSEDDEEDDTSRQEEEVEEEYIPHENDVKEEQSIIFNEDEESDSSTDQEESNSDEVISILDTDESSDNLQIDERYNNDEVRDKEFVEVSGKSTTENLKDKEEDSNEATDKTQNSSESNADPLNQALMSVLTDDNSVQSKSRAGTDSKVQMEDSNEATKGKIPESSEGSTNVLDQAQISLLTNDDSAHSDKSDGKLNYSDDKENQGNKGEQEKPVDVEMNAGKSKFQIQVTVETENVEEDYPECPKSTFEQKDVSEQTDLPQIDVVDATAATDKIISAEKRVQDTEKPEEQDVEMKDIKTKEDAPNISIGTKSSESEDVGTENVSKLALRSRKRSMSSSSVKSNKEGTSNVNIEAKSVESKSENTASEDVSKPALRTKKRTKSPSSNKSNKEETSKHNVEIKSSETESKSEDTASEDVGKPALRTKKRTKSTSSTKSNKEDKDTTVEVRTPVTRKRTQSVASNKSATEEQKTPEGTKNPETGTPRRRAKTPTSTEVRKILTRRASKELNQSASLDDSQSATEDTSLTTPKRRSTRSRSKNIDDNASVASESSVRSTRSKASEDGDSRPQRKAKKSVLAAVKPDLSVIPESTVEEAKVDSRDEIIADYSSSRRLTRHQKAMLESWMEPRRAASALSRDDDDASSIHSAFDVQPIDRIALMNKGDFEGSPDSSEVQSTISPESIASDASKQRRSRITRASSEARSTPKARSIRRVSVDVADITVSGSPVAGSPARGRRASFTRAVEALHTPKGRRASTDLRKGDNDSVSSSPLSESEVTPARRARQQSADTAGKRSRKLSAVEESMDTKKK